MDRWAMYRLREQIALFLLLHPVFAPVLVYTDRVLKRLAASVVT